MKSPKIGDFLFPGIMIQRGVMRILGIETSCDETALAVVDADGGLRRPQFRIAVNGVASQAKLHAKFGGVVPNLAKREHEKMLPFLWKKVQHMARNADVVAVTVGPGLEPCLWQGIQFAETTAKKLQKPIVAVNHMEGHLASVLLSVENDQQPTISFPALALLVSGGHTELVGMKQWRNYTILGETADDAAGEAFDKVARLLGLPYPGGPEVSRLAKEARKRRAQSELTFPRPMIHSRNLNFSFSGLKTAVLYALQKNPRLDAADVARAFEDAAVEVLVAKAMTAVRQEKPKTILVAGGVSANRHLRDEMECAVQKYDVRLPVLYPDPAFTGDNAAMIAAAAYFHAVKKKFTKPELLKAEGRLSIETKKR